MTAVLDDIRIAYQLARAHCDRTAVYAPMAAPPRTCRFCGKHWNPWPGSLLEGHTRCMVTLDFCVYLLERQHRLAIPTQRQIADHLGVTHAILRRWTRAGMDERERRLQGENRRYAFLAAEHLAALEHR